MASNAPANDCIRSNAYTRQARLHETATGTEGANGASAAAMAIMGDPCERRAGTHWRLIRKGKRARTLLPPINLALALLALPADALGILSGHHPDPALHAPTSFPCAAAGQESMLASIGKLPSVRGAEEDEVDTDADGCSEATDMDDSE